MCSKSPSYPAVFFKNTQKFCSLVHNTAWDEIYSNDSVDACYNSFENKISRCFELSFPYVRLVVAFLREPGQEVVL